MAGGDRVELEVEGFAHRGLGLARHAGQVVFVFGAIPGERVLARVTRVRARHAFADTEEVLRASPDRVEPRCPVFGRCGGCQLQHISAPRQLRLKQEVVVAALRRVGVDVGGARLDARAADAPYGYRWRGEFHRAPGPAGPGLGFTERHGYRRLAVDACPIHHPAINRALPALAAALAEGDAPEEGPDAGGVRTLHLTLGERGEELLVDPRPTGAAGPALVARAAPRLPEGPRLTAESTGLAYGRLWARVHPESFIQVNQLTLPALYETVAGWVEELTPVTAHLVDAYSGIGVLSCRLAEGGRRVTALEVNPVAARLARLHADLNGVADRVAVRAGPVERLLPGVPVPDLVVVDPPRSGLAPAVTGWLALEGPARVVYISCDPAALARDAHLLVALGPYRLDRLTIVDMFPQTYHVETLALLVRG